MHALPSSQSHDSPEVGCAENTPEKILARSLDPRRTRQGMWFFVSGAVAFAPFAGMAMALPPFRSLLAPISVLIAALAKVVLLVGYQGSGRRQIVRATRRLESIGVSWDEYRKFLSTRRDYDVLLLTCQLRLTPNEAESYRTSGPADIGEEIVRELAAYGAVVTRVAHDRVAIESPWFMGFQARIVKGKGPLELFTNHSSCC